jgi:ribonucleoside-triphosphate reductase (formate)
MPVVIGGELQKETYGEFQMEMDVFNRILCEVFTEGDASGRVFTFPIPTYNITKDFEWNNPAFDGIWRMTAKYGLPYFSNFINSDMSPDDARSMCIDKNEEILIKQEGVIKKAKIGDFIESLNVKFDHDG